MTVNRVTIRRQHFALVGAICLACVAALLRADDLLGLLDSGGDMASVLSIQDTLDALDGIPAVTQAEFETRLAATLKQTDPVARNKELKDLVAVLMRSQEILLMPRDMDAFAEAVIASGAQPDLAAATDTLLQSAESLQFNVIAQSRLNLVIRFALATGGVPFDRLKQIHSQFGSANWLELECLLPALGRAGGAQALPLVTPYRADASIIRLNNEQNIRRIPCASMLACAYGGDTNALEKTLTWYEEDTANLSRFAFSVAYAISEGMKPKYDLLDYVRHRIAQAEQLLDFLGKERIPDLLARVNRDASISLTSYAVAKMEAADAGDLPLFLPLADHPSPLVKQRALLTLFDRGDTVLREAVFAKLEAWLASSAGVDRFVATETLGILAPSRQDAVLAEAIISESNPTVRRRMETLRIGGAW